MNKPRKPTKTSAELLAALRERLCRIIEYCILTLEPEGKNIGACELNRTVFLDVEVDGSLCNNDDRTYETRSIDSFAIVNDEPVFTDEAGDGHRQEDLTIDCLAAAASALEEAAGLI